MFPAPTSNPTAPDLVDVDFLDFLISTGSQKQDLRTSIAPLLRLETAYLVDPAELLTFPTLSLNWTHQDDLETIPYPPVTDFNPPVTYLKIPLTAMPVLGLIRAEES